MPLTRSGIRRVSCDTSDCSCDFESRPAATAASSCLVWAATTRVDEAVDRFPPAAATCASVFPLAMSDWSVALDTPR